MSVDVAVDRASQIRRGKLLEYATVGYNTFEAATVGWWCADPLAALIMVPIIVREGLEGIRGERCEDDCGH